MDIEAFRIRRATEAEVPALAAMVAALFRIESDFMPDPAKQEAGLRALLAKGEEAAVFVAEQGGAAVGMVTVQLTVSTAQGGPSGLLEDMFVEESHRRKGLASALVASAVEWCVSKGAHRVQLLADSANGRALDFYAARGFETTRMVCLRAFAG